ncbi:hypothetical protein CERSUDRAFT_119422 [Gelatoporia subvermispora B]|uniref:F-box domain-containing protein n=1 Tax=Ceriporiopsis subvermispora (strain B) TaxID=914234 RepID=M2QID0_CERS8|nr:hypothetical protein CERSUDRAFT_119422 [Gelatoporia subvermispora B]
MFSQFDRLLQDSPHLGSCVKLFRSVPKTPAQRELFLVISGKLGNVEELAFLCPFRELPLAKSVSGIGPVKKLWFEIMAAWHLPTLAAYFDALPFVADLVFTISLYPEGYADSHEDLDIFSQALSKLRLKRLKTNGNACEILAPCLATRPPEAIQELRIEMADAHVEWRPVSCVMNTTRHSLKCLSITMTRQRWDEPTLPTLASIFNCPKLTHLILEANISNSKFIITLLPRIEAPQLQELHLEFGFANGGIRELSGLASLRDHLLDRCRTSRLREISIQIQAFVRPEEAWEKYKQAVVALFAPLHDHNNLQLELRYRDGFESAYYMYR